MSQLHGYLATSAVRPQDTLLPGPVQLMSSSLRMTENKNRANLEDYSEARPEQF